MENNNEVRSPRNRRPSQQVAIVQVNPNEINLAEGGVNLNNQNVIKIFNKATRRLFHSKGVLQHLL